MDPRFERVIFFLDRGRYVDAEKELRQLLSQNPNDGMAMSMMAQVLIQNDKRDEALSIARSGLAANPTEPMAFYSLAMAQFYNQKLDEAWQTTEQGLQVDPFWDRFFMMRAQIAMKKEEWTRALEQAEQGLARNPENTTLVNLRAQALLKLNRKEEASQTMDYALNREPENSYSHSNKGWVSIQRGKMDEAIESFTEALRLDPTNESARQGLKEAIKAKNPLYKGILSYFLWMGRMQARGRFAFIIGIYLLYQGLIWLASAYPNLAPFLTPLIIAYIIFAFSSWIAQPVSNLFLRLHPRGKHALDGDEKLASTLVGICLTGFLGFISAFYILGNKIFLDSNGNVQLDGDSVWLIMPAVFLGFMSLPISGLFNASRGSRNRSILIGVAVGLGIVGILGFTVIPQAGNLFFLGILIYTFVANSFMESDRRRV
ncbi:MAG: tetratricopeptide repeat protein [Bacteroidia bacterium]|nr:tetratricopeptide repeat protein [Bacteroidia bacterium]